MSAMTLDMAVSSNTAIYTVDDCCLASQTNKGETTCKPLKILYKMKDGQDKTNKQKKTRQTNKQNTSQTQNNTRQKSKA